MPLPDGVPSGTVYSGPVANAAGRMGTGTVTLIPVRKVTGHGAIIPASPVTLTVVAGVIPPQLVAATDDPAMGPPWVYEVHESLNGTYADPYHIEVPTGATVNLSTVAPVQVTPDWSRVVGSVNGVRPDINGNVEVDTALVQVIRRSTLTFGSPNRPPLAALASGAYQVTARMMQDSAITPTRYRLLYANVDSQSGVYAGTPLTLATAYVGTPAFDDPNYRGKWLGNFAAPPVQVYAGGGAVPTAGPTADLVTPWITNAGEITAGKPFVVSLGLIPGSGGAGVVVSDCFGAVVATPTAANQAGVVAPADGYAFAGGLGDLRVQMEGPADPGADLIVVGVGASGDSGYTAGNPAAGIRALADPPDAWLSAATRRAGRQVINLAANGSSLTDWTNPDGRIYTRVDLTTTVPDLAIIGTMVANDCQIGRDVGDILDDYAAVVDVLRGMGIPRVVGCTIPPAALAGSEEDVRREFNGVLGSGTLFALDGVIDLDAAVRDPANVAVMQADLLSVDGLHPLIRGHMVLASAARIT
ncbi:SGNH/GDSL hydrolase family protein [Actinokineospora spheciospongiae]|uniref:SGNH/GDSL hydrolase family protein n=1 Tax=Actinokineospora spheciospongiae TaxID=909613 RepID=UPI000D718188|nr:hypothetical protein [Actinokineospora spheciospongiae]PWW50277.1 hypothetical protein DFQ13_12339 [Actinokineospora spheciospongiae]